MYNHISVKSKLRTGKFVKSIGCIMVYLLLHSYHVVIAVLGIYILNKGCLLVKTRTHFNRATISLACTL